jgi:uncharacterized protein YcaQ
VASTRSLSSSEARRIALAAQGFAEPRPRTRPDHARLHRTIDRIHVLQIDSVNVLVRSHYLPLFSRLGGYDVLALDRAAYDGERSLFEYWGHEASLLPVALYPLLRWRMERAARGDEMYSGLARWGRRHRALIDAVLAEVTTRGPIAASELSNAGRSRGPWWGWSNGKRAIEWLFWAGRVTTATRRRFERVYDVPERVLPPSALTAAVPREDDAHRALLGNAARALGVATERDLREYFRLPVAETKLRLAELVEAGALERVTVEGWDRPAYLDPAAQIPKRVDARALLSPFDSLVFERQRTERVFDFHYRLAFYTPAAQRTGGYYVMPFLLGDRLVARIDLKADRAARVLRALFAQTETGVDPKKVARPLATSLGELSRWLGLERVDVGGRGDLPRALRACYAGRP